MEKIPNREIINENNIKNLNTRKINSHKNLKNNSNKIINPKKSVITKIQKEEKAKNTNINNKSLTDWNKKKIKKKIVNNLPPVPKLYLKKKVPPSNNNYLVNIIKKKNLSCTQEGIAKYTKKVVYDSKNISKKKITSDDISKCPDVDLEMEKDIGNDDESMRVHIPHMTGKKKSNYFFEIQKTDVKKNEKNKINDIREKNKNRLVLFPKFKNSNKKNFQYKKALRAKSEKKKEKKDNTKIIHKQNFKLYFNNNHDFINSGNSFLAFKKFQLQKNINNIKKEELYQYNDLFSSIEGKNIKSNKNNKNGLTSKTIEYNLIISDSKEYKGHISKKLNISLLEPKNLNENVTNNNIITILNSTSDFISGKETSDSPENITEKEEDKLSLPIHKINHFFIDERKRCQENIELNPKRNYFLSPNQNIELDLNGTDENCYVHQANISANCTDSSTKDNISSYKKNMNRFKNLTTAKKVPLSLFLSPAQKNNLFKDIEIKKIYNLKVKKNNLSLDIKINLNDLLTNNEYNGIKKTFENFLDIKSFIKLSSLNKTYYKNYRNILFEYLFDKAIDQKNNKEKREKFIMKVIKSIFKYCTKKFKNKKELTTFYNNYKVKSKYEADISKDLPRTCPNDKSFSKGSKNYKKLYNILTCFSNYNKNIGYAQGLNFIGAVAIYIFGNEEIGFLFLDSLVNRLELDNYFGINNQNLTVKLMKFSDVLKKYIPDIISYLERQQINHDFFSTGWILTLFSNSMKRKCLVYSWAFMIIFGWKFFYSLAIQILIWYKKEIFNTNISKLCFKMKNILIDDKFELNYNDIIKKTFSFMHNNITL